MDSQEYNGSLKRRVPAAWPQVVKGCENRAKNLGTLALPASRVNRNSKVYGHQQDPRPHPVRPRGNDRQPFMNRVVMAGLRSPLHRLLDAGTNRTPLPDHPPGRGHHARHVCQQRAPVVLVGQSRDQTYGGISSPADVDVWWHCARRPTQLRRSPTTPPSTPRRQRPTGRNIHISGPHKTRRCWSPFPRFPPRHRYPQPEGEAHCTGRETSDQI